MLTPIATLLAAASIDGALVTHDELRELLASRDAAANRLERRVAALESENAVLRARLPLETSPQPSAPSVSNVGASGAASPPTVPIASTGKADGRRGTSVHMQAGEVEANGSARRLSSGSSSYLSVDGDRSLVHTRFQIHIRVPSAAARTSKCCRSPHLEPRRGTRRRLPRTRCNSRRWETVGR